MPEVPIPFSTGLASGLDELSGVSPLWVNFLRDAAGAIRVRPGVRAWSDFGAAPAASAVIGLYSWRQWLLFVTADRRIWAWQGPADPAHPGSNILALSSADTTTQLDGTLRPIWTYDQQRVSVTGGGAPQQWQGSGLSSRLAPGQTSPDGSPLALTHIACLAQRFVGNDNSNSGILQWTAPGQGNHGTWPIVGAFFAEAEAAPDPVVATYANTNELFAFGTQTMQVLLPDPTNAFAPAASVQLGCSAPYSVIDTDGSFAWLDDRHRFVQSGGRKFDVLSTPLIANDVMAPGFVVSDCWGARLCIGTFDLLLWAFPAQARAFFYDRTLKKWGEFRSLDANGNWIPWVPQSYFFWAEKNIHLVGLSDGTIGEVSFSATTDNGLTLKAVANTGFQDRGTFRRKVCQRAQLQFRRGGTTPPGPAPIVELRYRDDLGGYRQALQWSQGIGGDYQPVVDRWNLGVYREREWELTWTGGGPFILTGATETMETGDS